MAAAGSAFRVQKDLKELAQSPNLDQPIICAEPVEERLDHVVALIMGPHDTPYQFGFFLLDLKFSSTYPNDPPRVKFQTTDSGKVRFNPNLYADGKVCLSILGTWRGETAEVWRSSYSLGYVLNAIQSMIMNSEPFHNEPGFDKDALLDDTMDGSAFPAQPSTPLTMESSQTPGQTPGASPLSPALTAGSVAPPTSGFSPPGAPQPAPSPEQQIGAAPQEQPSPSHQPQPSPQQSRRPRMSQAQITWERREYSAKITHETIRVAVCEVLESLFTRRSDLHLFAPVIKREFLCRYNLYVEVCKAHSHRDGKSFHRALFEFPSNLCDGTFNYTSLTDRLARIRDTLEGETETWKNKGRDLTSKMSYAASTLRDTHKSLVADESVQLVGGPVDDSNVFVWNVTFMQIEGHYEEGVYTVEIVFPESAAEIPRARFLQPIWHPNVSLDGIPYFHIPMEKRDATGYFVENLRHLLQSALPSPATWLNPEAGQQMFSNDAAKTKLFRRQARQWARRTVEGE